MATAARVPQGRRWPLVVVLLAGVAIVAGAFSVYRDQRSGTPGTATVTRCEGGSQRGPGIRCTGTWLVGGERILDGARVVVGRVEGAGYADIGKTIDVRVHGADHVTKPSLGTPIVLWSIGGLLMALAAVGLLAGRRSLSGAA